MLSKNPTTTGEDGITESVTRLISFYNEISADELKMEISILKRHSKLAKLDLIMALINVKDWVSLYFLSFFVEWDFVKSLPNITLSLKLLLYLYLLCLVNEILNIQ